MCAEEGIEADFVQGRNPPRRTEPCPARPPAGGGRIRARWGLGEDDLRLLEPDELRERIRIADALGASFTPHCARVHPARLVRGLADTVERRGGDHLRGDAGARASGSARSRRRPGDVRAEWIVRATEGYTAQLPGLERSLLPLGSSMIVTEPLPAEVWAEIGWDALRDARSTAHTSTSTRSGPRTAGSRSAAGACPTGSARASTGTPSARRRRPTSSAGRSARCSRRPHPCRSTSAGRACSASPVTGAHRSAPIGARVSPGRVATSGRRQHGEPDRAHARRPHARSRERARHASVGRAHVPALRARAAALHRRPHALPGVPRRRSP